MDLEKFTDKARSIIQSAHSNAVAKGHQNLCLAQGNTISLSAKDDQIVVK